MRSYVIALSLLVSCFVCAQEKAFQPVEGPPPQQRNLKFKVPPATESLVIAQLAEARWMPAQKLDPKIPPGAEVAVVGVEPVSRGPIVYLKLKAGYTMPLHWHARLESDTAIAGKGTLVVDGKSIAIAPGTFVMVPSKAKHELHCDAGAECVFVVRRSGPADYNWVAK
jgi:quercetin dioxygenase-like cupin family protein